MQISECDIPGQVSDDVRPELIFEAQACKFLLELLGACLVLIRLLGLHCGNTKCSVPAHPGKEPITCEIDTHRMACSDAEFTACTVLLAFVQDCVPCDDRICLDRLPCIIGAVPLLVEAHEVPAAKNLACCVGGSWQGKLIPSTVSCLPWVRSQCNSATCKHQL